MSASAPHAGPGWSEALRLATGYEADLRGLCNGNAMISPTLFVYGKAASGAGVQMENNAGQPAIDRLVEELANLAEIMPSLQSGQFRLMDIELLREATTLMARQSATLADLRMYAGRLVAASGPSADGPDGAFRSSLAAELARLEDHVSAQLAVHQTGERPIEDLLDDAAQALSSFGTRMARAFYEARPTLVEVATSFWEGARTNIDAYWKENGWGPGGPNSRLFAEAPETAEILWDAAMRGYSSAGLPGLPAGTPTIATDLIDGWHAFGAALTQRLGQVLDVMDEEANDAFAALSDAYRAVITALGAALPESDDAFSLHEASASLSGIPVMPQMTGVLMAEAVPASQGILAEAVPASQGVLAEMVPASPVLPLEEGTPAQPASPLLPAHPLTTPEKPVRRW
jgi:hypothetical protein